MIYIAYLLVTVPMLVKRLRGEWPPKDAREKGYFTLGKLGLPINILAVVLGRGHGDQPRLAAQGRLQRDRAVPLVPPVRRDPVHRRRLLRRARLLLVRAAPQDRACSPRTRSSRAVADGAEPRRAAESGSMARACSSTASGATPRAAPPSRPRARPPASRSARSPRATARTRGARSPRPTRPSRPGRRAPASSAPSCCTAWRTRASAARDELARILTLDQGKPLKAEAEVEVGELVEFFRMAAEDGKRVQGIDPRERRARAGACCCCAGRSACSA